MISNNYSIAMAETLHYLKGISKHDIKKIPKEFITYLKENADTTYKCDFDYNKSLNDLDLKVETRGIISHICFNYWCETEEQKKLYLKRLRENEAIYQKELKSKYNTDVFANKRNNIKNEETVQLVKYKETWFKKILNKIKSIIKK